MASCCSFRSLPCQTSANLRFIQQLCLQAGLHVPEADLICSTPVSSAVLNQCNYVVLCSSHDLFFQPQCVQLGLSYLLFCPLQC